MNHIEDLLQLAQNGNKNAETQLITLYEPVINKYARQNGLFDEDCKQVLMITFILAVRRFDMKRYL